MSQILRKKKGRPSKADLAARAAVADSNNGHSYHNRRPTAAAEEEYEEQQERDIRRSLRRRSGVRYNLLDYDDEDYLDDDDEFEFEESGMEAEDDGGRREKKLKFVLKIRNSSDSGRAGRSNGGGGSGDSAVRSRRSGYRGSESEEEEEEDNEDEKSVKKRKINEEEDEMDDDFGNNDDEEERDGKKGDNHKPDFLYGGMNDPLSPTPMPEKKQLELILDKLQKKDTYGVYADPVDPDELPDYHDIITNPMDFSTVRKKLVNGSYTVFEQFESDIYLICSNAMKYNTSDTVYHKQARTIKELAQMKFHRVRSYIKRTRIENEGNKKEMNSEQKAKPTPIVNKQMRNSLGHSAQDPVSSDFSYGATLATTDPHNTCNGVQNITFERHSNCEGLVEDMSSLHVESSEKVEDVRSGKGMAKFGRKPLAGDENHRATYEISNQPVDRSESIFATFEGEDKQLIPVGLYEQHSYAQSLAHYAANLGSVAWRTASKRIEQALPQGSMFGRGWVMEYEPTPTPLLYQSPKEYASAKKPHFPAASAKHQKPSETKTSPIMVLGIGGIALNVEPCFSPSGSVQQQNPFVRKLQNASNLVDNPTPADDRGPKRPISDSKPPQMPSITPTGTPSQQHNPFGRRLQSTCIPAKINKCSNSIVTTSGHPENGSVLPTIGGSRPATPTGPVLLPHNLFSRTMRPSMDANTSIPSHQKATNPFTHRQLSGSAENPATRNNFLQPVPVRPQLQASGNVNRSVDINQMATTSPSSGPKMSFPPRQEQQGLSDPLQAMRVSVEKAQKQQSQMHNLLGPLQVRPSIIPQRGGDNTCGATAAWMHASPADLNRPSQIPAGSLHNNTQELYHPHILQSSECAVPGLRHVPAAHEYNHAKASNEAHGRNRPTAFPQMLGGDVSRMQLQSPRHGLSPRAEQKRNRDTLPPDLNVAFQSTVDPQQPDLALQL